MTIAFLSIFAAGFALAVISWVFGELFDFGGEVADAIGEVDVVPEGIGIGDALPAGADLGAGADVSTPSPASSRVIFSGLTAFGGFGFIGSALDWPLAATILFALLGFVLAAGGMFFGVVLPIARQQGSLHVDRRKYVGLDVSVATTIPADGVGQVTFPDPNSGALVTESASSSDGSPIAQATAVRIVRVDAGGVVVAPVGGGKEGRS